MDTPYATSYSHPDGLADGAVDLNALSLGMMQSLSYWSAGRMLT